MTHRTPFNRTPLEWSALGHIAVAALIVGGGLVLSATCAAAEASTAAAGAASIPDLIQSRDTNPVLPVDGTYLVDEDVSFVVDHEGGETLLRFAGDDEIFTLSVEHAPLGGRVLKYDTGDLAMAVSSWGGVTIYTATVPSGTPADRVGEGAKLTPTPPSIQDMRKLASAWAQRLQHDLALATHFDADWETQLLSGDERRFVADAMLNIERAFARIKNSAASRGAAAKIDVVRIEQAKKANVVSRGGTLTVTVAPGPSLSSRPSSLAIARALTQSR